MICRHICMKACVSESPYAARPHRRAHLLCGVPVHLGGAGTIPDPLKREGGPIRAPGSAPALLLLRALRAARAPDWMSQLVRALSGRRRAQRRSAYDAATGAPVMDASAAAETFLFQLSPAALRGAPAGVRRVALSLYSAAGDLLQATPSREVRARARAAADAPVVPLARVRGNTARCRGAHPRGGGQGGAAGAVLPVWMNPC